MRIGGLALKRRDKKRIMIASGAASLLFLTTIVVVAIVGGKDDSPTIDLPGLEEYGEETIPLQAENIMVEDGQTMYWDIGRPGNSTDIILVTGIQVLIAWSDDEMAPATRPLYTNTPDTFILSAIGVPLLSRDNTTAGNNTNQTTEDVVRISSTSQMGTTRVALNILNNPILLSRSGNDTGTEWEWDPAGAAEPGNTGLFINITCIAGHIESSRPALLRYTDPGDEVTISISLSFKSVPDEVVQYWLKNNKRA
jgi:hypothetical protein